MLELISIFPVFIWQLINELIDITFIFKVIIGIALWDLFKFIHRDWRKK